jgi:hypothetical protein
MKEYVVGASLGVLFAGLLLEDIYLIVAGLAGMILGSILFMFD